MRSKRKRFSGDVWLFSIEDKQVPETKKKMVKCLGPTRDPSLKKKKKKL